VSKKSEGFSPAQFFQDLRIHEGDGFDRNAGKNHQEIIEEIQIGYRQDTIIEAQKLIEKAIENSPFFLRNGLHYRMSDLPMIISFLQIFNKFLTNS
jgi:hypothetical protein